MRIKFTRDTITPREWPTPFAKEGEVKEVDDATAAKWIGRGAAVAIDDGGELQDGDDLEEETGDSDDAPARGRPKGKRR